jgi:hypothetical protein
MRIPTHCPETNTSEDPYKILALAIVKRAYDDARGHCQPIGHEAREQLIRQARAWLADTAAVCELLELAGYEAQVVLARLSHRITH